MNWLKQNVVKEAFDQLPCGVCFFDRNGFVVMCNHQMYRLIFAISGRDLQSLSEFQDILENNNMQNETEKEIFLLNDGSAWRFSQENIKTNDGKVYMQVTASNVTDLYQKQKELEDNNFRLEDYALRMRRLSANMVTLIREEEILKMKMRVHNDIGRSMIATRRFLNQNRPIEELDLTVWKNAVRLLKNDNELSDNKETLAQLYQAAGNLNVKILLTGKLPEDADASELLVAVIWECMTNAVRHAGATEIYGSLYCDDSRVCLEITNNGDVPKGTITEGGGLSSLRIRVGISGGTMQIKSTPRFELTVTVPVKQEKKL